MNRKKSVIHKWTVLAAGIIIFASGGLEPAAADEAAFSGALYSSALRDRAALPADLHRRAGNSIHSEDVEDEKVTNDPLIDANIGVKQYEPGSPEKIRQAVATPHIPKYLSVIGPLAPDAGSSSIQPLMGIIWNHKTESRRNWNIVLGLGGFNHPPKSFAPFDITEQILETEKNDITDQIRDAIQVIGFEIRYDF